MSIHACVICCTNFKLSDDLFSTYCGHVFHFPCLSQWLERSKTCPQCRQKTDNKKIHRIYLYSGNNDTSIKEDASALQEKIDNLEYQMRLRDKDMTFYKSEAGKFKNQAVGLRQEVHKLSAEINQKETQIAAFKEQSRYLKDLKNENDTLKTDYVRVKRQLDDMKDVKMMIEATNDDAEGIIDVNNDTQKLSTYVLVLKRELTTANANRKQYREKIRKLQSELSRCEAEKAAAIENVKKYQSKIKLLEQVQMKTSNGMSNLLSPKNDKVSETMRTSDGSSSSSGSGGIMSFKLSPAIQRDDDETDENSSGKIMNSFKVQNLRVDNKRKLSPQKNAPLRIPSSLVKKPRPADDPMAIKKVSSETYTSNGLGSYSRIEHFPVANGAIKKDSSRVMKLRKMKSSQLSSANNAKIDAFVDLT